MLLFDTIERNLVHSFLIILQEISVQEDSIFLCENFFKKRDNTVKNANKQMAKMFLVTS